MVEVARLESVYRFIAYRGFESPSLRQDSYQKVHSSFEKAAVLIETAAFFMSAGVRQCPVTSSYRWTIFWGKTEQSQNYMV